MSHPDLQGVLLKNLSVDVTQNNKKLVDCNSIQGNLEQYTGTHGTAVTGVLAAEANNGIGLAGAASIGSHNKFRNNIKIMAIKADKKKGGRHITLSQLGKAIEYAVNKGAKVINLSYSAPASSFDAESLAALKKVVQNAINSGVTLVCAAGNDSSTDGRYPAAFQIPGVIRVGAYNSYGNLTTYTNRSKSIDIVAPSGDQEVDGKRIMTTAPIAMDTTGYKFSGGTSCATPQVTATVAMMLSLNVYLTPAQIEQRIKNRTDEKKNIAGFPRLDTGKAVSMTVYKP